MKEVSYVFVSLKIVGGNEGWMELSYCLISLSMSVPEVIVTSLPKS